MSEYIEREALISDSWKALYKYENEQEKRFMEDPELDVSDWFFHRIHVQMFHARMLDIIKDIPAADVRPVVRGKWEDVEVTYVADKTTLPFERISSMRCNQCNRYHTEIYYYGNPTEMANYCPNCGADMREGN